MKAILIMFLLVFANTLFAKTYEVNSQHSFVNFEVDYMQVSVVKGSFEKFKGAFDWDGQRLTNVEFEIQAKSVNTRDSKRDNHLKKEDFFHTTKHPIITLKGGKVVYKNGNPESITGKVILRGHEKEVYWKLDWKGVLQDAVDTKKKSLFFSATATINRKEFGVNWNKALDQGGWVVGDDVKIDIVIEANPTDSRPAFSRFYVNKKETVAQSTDIPTKTTKKFEVGARADRTSSAVIPEPEVKRSLVDLVVGFILFVLLCVGGFFLKKQSLTYLEGKISETKAELLSDAVLYTLLFVLAIYLAPYMGYSKYFN